MVRNLGEAGAASAETVQFANFVYLLILLSRVAGTPQNPFGCSTIHNGNPGGDTHGTRQPGRGTQTG